MSTVLWKICSFVFQTVQLTSTSGTEGGYLTFTLTLAAHGSSLQSDLVNGEEGGKQGRREEEQCPCLRPTFQVLHSPQNGWIIYDNDSSNRLEFALSRLLCLCFSFVCDRLYGAHVTATINLKLLMYMPSTLFTELKGLQ